MDTLEPTSPPAGTPPASTFYVTGGTMPIDAPSYVERRADGELLGALRRGEFTYVLDTRQVGKSSLMVRAAARLREDGVRVAMLDLARCGRELSVDQWYYGMLLDLGEQVGIREAARTFWQANRDLGPLQRFFECLRGVAIPAAESPLVVFVDEIDCVRKLAFSTDEFFGGIRECCTRRADEPGMRRLTFCLLGSATPASLVSDVRTTPFNIGTGIVVTGFTESEAAPLAAGLDAPGRSGAALLARVLYWTAGHPYLTQQLCQSVAEGPGAMSGADVDRVCEEVFLTRRAREGERNLAGVARRVLETDKDVAAVLDVYQQVHRGRHVPHDPGNEQQSELLLSGLLQATDGVLRVRNRIYARVFDRAWIEQNMPDAEKRRQRAACRRGVLWAAAVAGAVLVVMAGLTWWAISADARTRRANARLQRAYGVLRATIKRVHNTGLSFAGPERLKLRTEAARADAIKAKALYEGLVQAAELASTPKDQATLYLNLSTVCYSLDQLREAILYTERALDRSIQAMDRAYILGCLNNMDSLSATQGIPNPLAYHSRALELRQRWGTELDVAHSLRNLGLYYAGKDQNDRALEYYRQVLPVCERSSALFDRQATGTTCNDIAKILSDQKRYKEAIPLFKRAAAVFRQIGDRGLEGEALLNLGSAHGYLGQTDRMADYYRQAIPLFDAAGMKAEAAQLRSALRDVALSLLRSGANTH